MEALMRQAIWLTAAVFIAAIAVPAAVTKSQANRLREAAIVLHEIHKAPDRDIPNDLWAKAECIAVFPSVKKAAFVIGGEYGKGVISCRHGADWSAPAFMILQKGSIGFQIGGEAVDLVLLVMNDHGMNRLLQDKVALGGEASVAGGPVGRDARAMTDAQLKAEILSYSRSQGLFAGLDVSGGVIMPDRDDNHDLYGADVSPRDILVDKHVSTPEEASGFIAALRRNVPPGE
jgi:lipid-binding SYLF domain-containing protein